MNVYRKNGSLSFLIINNYYFRLSFIWRCFVEIIIAFIAIMFSKTYDLRSIYLCIVNINFNIYLKFHSLKSDLSKAIISCN
jgi:hypothetical protein